MRREIPESLAISTRSLVFASNLVECLLYALLGELKINHHCSGLLTIDSRLVKIPVTDDEPLIPDSTGLITQLLRLLQVGQSLTPTQLYEVNIHKLVCYTFAVLIEGSVRDPSFWAATKEQSQFDQLIFSLLVEESRQLLRKGIADKISLICSPAKQLKNPKLPVPQAQGEPEAALSENPARVDILATMWDAFVHTFPRVLEFPSQCQEFFEVAHLVFSSVTEKSPHDVKLSDYLKQWSSIMLSHRTTEVCLHVFLNHLRS